MGRDEPLPGFDDRAPRDRYCDLILTGGVTSAIAYPAAVFALAGAYRLHAIGGSSSGAGVAALAAAAEYRRRHGSADGFRILLQRTDAVADVVAGKTGLEWLFQPDVENERLFGALLPAFVSQRGRVGVLTQSLLAVYGWKALMYSAIAAAAFLLASASLSRHGTWPAWVGWATAGVAGAAWVGVTVGAIAWLIWRDLRRLVAADFGLCSGLGRQAGAPRPPLTEWLHTLIQEVAGRGSSDAPLTFADLERAPGAPRDTLGDLSANGTQAIGLRMFTANLAQGRPHVLPLREADAPLYFQPHEMRRLFPAGVVDHMKRHSAVYAGDAPWARPTDGRTAPRAPLADGEDELWRLPCGELPIVVAARMSIAFPVLFSAVPLWTLDNGPDAVFRRCLFADGGLCSNFPIHLFDQSIPAWPTFGITLRKVPARRAPDAGRQRAHDCLKRHDGQDAVTLADDHRDGPVDAWNDFDEARLDGDRLFGFFSALLSTATDWNDALLAHLPGVRDRVAQIWLAPEIGGLNIRMTSEQIRCLGRLGGEAGKKLLNRFAKASAPDGVAAGWNEHRWVRFNILRDCLSRTLAGLAWSAQQARYAQPLREQIDAAVDAAPLNNDEASQLRNAEAAALQGALDALVQAERELNARTVAQPYIPAPRPELRVRPPL